MTFPERTYGRAREYMEAYLAEVAAAARSVEPDKIEAATEILAAAYRDGRMVFSCGNGGSAAIANHLLCDHSKLVRTDTDLNSRVCSLSTCPEIITAVGNDLSFEEIFAYQLRSLARPGDVLITISSSGDSENVVRAARWAKENGLVVIAMSGFSGGRTASLADVSLHVQADNYGVIEDVHQSLMHIMAQHIRQAHMDATLVASRRF